MATIQVNGLTKDYDDVRAVDSVSFTVEAGEVFGFLGPNGAGKTTTIRSLLGLIDPSAGSATVLDADIHDEQALLDANGESDTFRLTSDSLPRRPVRKCSTITNLSKVGRVGRSYWRYSLPLSDAQFESIPRGTNACWGSCRRSCTTPI